MEFKTDALVLRTADYGENDRMLTLITADRGKISAAAKGVRKAGAKLGFAAQPFCFAEFVFAARSGRNTVISAAMHDGFYALREDVAAFFAAAAVTEACDKLVFEGMESGTMLALAVRALRDLCGGKTSRALVKFLLLALREAGYPVRADRCPVCGRALPRRLRFEFASGAFTCADCSQGAPASEATLAAVRAAGSEGDGSGEGSGDGETRALRLLKAYFAYQTEGELRALGEYLALK